MVETASTTPISVDEYITLRSVLKERAMDFVLANKACGVKATLVAVLDLVTHFASAESKDEMRLRSIVSQQDTSSFFVLCVEKYA